MSEREHAGTHHDVVVCSIGHDQLIAALLLPHEHEHAGQMVAAL
jgi:hypothetical protein